MNLTELKYDEHGLIPAVVQDFFTNEVLMVAYMNADSLAITIAEKRTCFYSRSRQELWRKGETSGNVQHVVSVKTDCDMDAVVVKVIKDGPACHNGTESCFTQLLYEDEAQQNFTLKSLYEMLLGRKADPKEGSYTSYLFEKGRDKILKKVGEESTEVIIAGAKGERGETIYEVSDLCYHVLVLMVECGIEPSEIMKELASRHVVDRKVKQETMQ